MKVPDGLRLGGIVFGRCFRAVDSISDEEPKCIAIAEEAEHQIVHGCRFGKANGATHETFDPCP